MDINGALEDFTAYVNLAPEEADGYVRRARLLIDSGNWEGANADLEVAKALAPNDPAIYLLQAQIQQHNDDHKAAVDSL